MIFVQCYNALDSEARGGDDGNGGPMNTVELKGYGLNHCQIAWHLLCFSREFICTKISTHAQSGSEIENERMNEFTVHFLGLMATTLQHLIRSVNWLITAISAIIIMVVGAIKRVY